MEGPRLIESGAHHYMSGILQSCHSTRVNIYLYALNIGVFVLFVGITAAVLYYCYRNRLSPEEAYQKRLKEQEYILSKIRYYKEQQRNIASRASITGLPTMDPRPI
jgi:hypothetical protein